MTDYELREIAKREEKATPGPWYVRRRGTRNCYQWQIRSGPKKPSTLEKGPLVTLLGWGDEPLANFIAHAREDIPALIAEVQRLKNAAEAESMTEQAETIKHLRELLKARPLGRE